MHKIVKNIIYVDFHILVSDLKPAIYILRFYVGL